MHKFQVGILGATGSVGQRFIQMLDMHPWFSITTLIASHKSMGKTYEEAVSWKQSTPIPPQIRSVKIRSCDDTDIPCDFVFSGLDSSVAGPVEEEFAKKGYPVISNSKNHRMDPDVPLLIPEINPEHLQLISVQKRKRGYSSGFIVTNPNCSVIGLTLALKPIQQAYGLTKIQVTTMQALSGAGFPGVASMDILDNVIPYIPDEEEKIETEPQKILGTYEAGRISPAKITISAQANRVAVTDGHTEAVSIKVQKKTSIDKLKKLLSSYKSIPQTLSLPSAPQNPLVVYEEINRPQPRLDRDRGKGMAVSIGRIRPCSILDYKFIVLSHNTIRGAAGAAILNAELLINKNFIQKRT